MPVVREPEIASLLSQSPIDIMVLDAGFSLEGTGRLVRQVKGNSGSAETVLILFSASRAQLQRACVDREVLKNVDDVQVLRNVTQALQALAVSQEPLVVHRRDAGLLEDFGVIGCAENFGHGHPVGELG